MSKILVWLLSGALSVALTVLLFCPASWLVLLVEHQTGGRVTLGDAQGSLWQGSAFIGGAPGGADAVTPLLPGRFSWRLSPALMLGRVDLHIENASTLSQPVQIAGSWTHWQVTPAAILLQAERLSSLGAPLNTVQLSGQMHLSWTSLTLTRQGSRIDMTGTMHLDMNDMASRLSSIKPLGAYGLTMEWQGQEAELDLKTIKGPMLLSGTGKLVNGRLQFSGKAEAEEGQQERLAVLLNLLGQRRREGNKNIIALEFK